MRTILFMGVALLLAGCLKFGKDDTPRATQTATPKPPSQVQVQVASAPGQVTDCYTVDLFTPEKVRKPEKDVPEKYKAYLGRWGGGAWNDVWCHNLLVYKVHKDGQAELVEMHAPYEPFNQPATAFNRIGRIGDDGVLRFTQGLERTAYKIDGGYLFGTRGGVYGNLEIVLRQKGMPPIPRRKPVRLAQAITATPEG